MAHDIIMVIIIILLLLILLLLLLHIHSALNVAMPSILIFCFRYVRVVYIKCSDGDGTFQAPPGVKNDIEEAIKRLSFNARLLQTFMAESLYQHGLGHHTFRLEEDEAGNPKVHVFTSKLTMSEALKMNGDQLYKAFLTGENCIF